MKKYAYTLLAIAGFAFTASCGGGGNSGDIEAWLLEIGNDFPDVAKCVADEMSDSSLSDFEKSFEGEASDEFETDLDAAYTKCEEEFDVSSTE